MLLIISKRKLNVLAVSLINLTNITSALWRLREKDRTIRSSWQQDMKLLKKNINFAPKDVKIWSSIKQILVTQDVVNFFQTQSRNFMIISIKKKLGEESNTKRQNIDIYIEWPGFQKYFTRLTLQIIQKIYALVRAFQLYYCSMSNGDGSLLNFLRKTAAQARSSGRNTKKSSTVMQDRDFDQRSIITFQGGSTTNFHSPKLERQLFGSNSLSHPSNQILLFERKNEQLGNNWQNYASNPQKKSVDNFRLKTNPQELYSSTRHDPIKQALGHTTSFQSARMESAQCLQRLSTKIRNQITNIDIKIQRFNSSIGMVITDHFRSIKEHIYQMVEQVIRLGTQQMQSYKRLHEQKLVGDLFRMKELLTQEYAKIQNMREGIGKPNWRKVAGEIISSDLEPKVNDLLRRSALIEARRWQLPVLNMAVLNDIQRKLVDCMKIG